MSGSESNHPCSSRFASVVLGCVWASTLGCGAPPRPKPFLRHAPQAYSAAHHLMPGDLDLVVRADWARLRDKGQAKAAQDIALAFGLHEQIPVLLEGCLEQTRALWVGLRMRASVAKADAIVALEGSGLVQENRPSCSATAWTLTSEAPGQRIYEPSRFAQRMGEPALLLVLGSDNVVLATAAQVDALKRLLRNGPDERLLEPDASSVIGVDVRGGDRLVAPDLREKFPLFASLTQGLERARISCDLDGQLAVRGSLSYRTAKEAAAAGDVLTQIRQALASSERPAFQEIAKRAHASVLDELLKVHFAVAL